ncbi:uncharacterized protein BDR25DRAFT_356220 [Lindgomyces ingoldianus]|uniref:Uncharacterized protein n=1 Tax=Lindgomyces ingoldianus TaxID=673940 RepID=A0ACB6QT99_9PLEO|nr:uncharacterized protein BDR25DRAFT_356220 [Lindgomyces ingoldianus]KAF2469527.1 hypothetical protein BDR25DRAFT_356220 [Lindgomyces ingoldianus]
MRAYRFAVLCVHVLVLSNPYLTASLIHIPPSALPNAGHSEEDLHLLHEKLLGSHTKSNIVNSVTKLFKSKVLLFSKQLIRFRTCFAVAAMFGLGSVLRVFTASLISSQVLRYSQDFAMYFNVNFVWKTHTKRTRRSFPVLSTSYHNKESHLHQDGSFIPLKTSTVYYEQLDKWFIASFNTTSVQSSTSAYAHSQNSNKRSCDGAYRVTCSAASAPSLAQRVASWQGLEHANYIARINAHCPVARQMREAYGSAWGLRDLGIPMTPIGLVRRISENYRASYGARVEPGSEPIRGPFGWVPGDPRWNENRYNLFCTFFCCITEFPFYAIISLARAVVDEFMPGRHALRIAHALRKISKSGPGLGAAQGLSRPGSCLPCVNQLNSLKTPEFATLQISSEEFVSLTRQKWRIHAVAFSKLRCGKPIGYILVLIPGPL